MLDCLIDFIQDATPTCAYCALLHPTMYIIARAGDRVALLVNSGGFKFRISFEESVLKNQF